MVCCAFNPAVLTRLTCTASYANSIIQCLYYSAPFRDHVINFPSLPAANGDLKHTTSPSLEANDPRLPRSALASTLAPASPGPLAANSPARRPIVLAGTPAAQGQKVDEKDSPEWRKKMLMQAGPVLDMQLDYSNAYGMPESLFTALKDIFEAIIAHPGRTGIISPHKFLEILRKENEMFRSAMHQDAHEFLNLLLNQVVDNVELYSKQQRELTNPVPGIIEQAAAVSGTSEASAGWVHDLFKGLLVSETRCLTCETTSQRDEAFMDLSVDLQAHSSVTSCLRKFSEEEMLCERNKFHCDTCGGLQEAEKRMKIRRLPKILALHLKRFEYSEDFSRLQKLFHRVSYPFHLRLFNTTDDAEEQDKMYELYAVVVHIGGGPYHGHYVSIIKTEDRGWLLFDDELVEPVDRSYVQNFFGGEPKTGVQDAKQLACAYVLFYQETTLEAVERELASETAAAAAAMADAVPGSPVASPTSSGMGGLWSNGFRQMQSITTPVEEKEEPFANLAHAVTAPTDQGSAASQTQSGTTAPTPLVSSATNTSPHKTKRELRKEEKAAEKERKAAEKEAEKQARLKRQEVWDARRARIKQQEEELQAVLEASKLTAAEEAARPPPAPANDAATPVPMTIHEKETSGGLSRFARHGSISLKQKPRFWSGGKDKENKGFTAAAVPEAPEENGKSVLSKTTTSSKKDDEEKDVKRNRFSLGRKKGTMTS